MCIRDSTYVVVVLSLIVMIIAELIRKIGNYNSFKYNMLSYAVFCIWICSSMMQMLLAKEVYVEHLSLIHILIMKKSKAS